MPMKTRAPQPAASTRRRAVRPDKSVRRRAVRPTPAPATPRPIPTPARARNLPVPVPGAPAPLTRRVPTGWEPTPVPESGDRWAPRGETITPVSADGRRPALTALAHGAPAALPGGRPLTWMRQGITDAISRNMMQAPRDADSNPATWAAEEERRRALLNNLFLRGAVWGA